MSKSSYEAVNASFRILSSLLQDFQPADIPRTTNAPDTLTQMKAVFQASQSIFDGLLTSHRERNKPAETKRKKMLTTTEFKMLSAEDSRKSFEAKFASHQPKPSVRDVASFTHSGLLSLPIELRYKIWGYVITPSTGNIDLQHSQGRPDLALAFVNREICAEVKYILHHDIELRLQLWDYSQWKLTLTEIEDLYRPEDLAVDDNESIYDKQWQLTRDEMFRNLAIDYAQSFAIAMDPQLLANFCHLTIHSVIPSNLFTGHSYAEGGRRDERVKYGVDSRWSCFKSWKRNLASALRTGYSKNSPPKIIVLEWDYILHDGFYLRWLHLRTRSSRYRPAKATLEGGLKNLICTWRDCVGGTNAIAEMLENSRPNLHVVSKPILVMDDFQFEFEEMDGEIVKGSLVDIAIDEQRKSGVEKVSFKFVRTKLVEFDCKWSETEVIVIN